MPNPKSIARELRRNQTKPEELLWSHLRNRQLCNLKFRRQHPIACYVVDFYCHEKSLVIELDGNSHDESRYRYDVDRQKELENRGLEVVRFSNDEVLKKVDWVLEMILLACGINLDKRIEDQ